MRGRCWGLCRGRALFASPLVVRWRKRGEVGVQLTDFPQGNLGWGRQPWEGKRCLTLTTKDWSRQCTLVCFGCSGVRCFPSLSRCLLRRKFSKQFAQRLREVLAKTEQTLRNPAAAREVSFCSPLLFAIVDLRIRLADIVEEGGEFSI